MKKKRGAERETLIGPHKNKNKKKDEKRNNKE